MDSKYRVTAREITNLCFTARRIARFDASRGEVLEAVPNIVAAVVEQHFIGHMDRFEEAARVVRNLTDKQKSDVAAEYQHAVARERDRE